MEGEKEKMPLKLNRCGFERKGGEKKKEGEGRKKKESRKRKKHSSKITKPFFKTKKELAVEKSRIFHKKKKKRSSTEKIALNPVHPGEREKS